MQYHYGVGQLPSCGECGKQFTTTRNLKKHEQMHTETKNHKCEICGIRFLSKGNLGNHLKTHKGLKSKRECEDKAHECYFCEQRFNFKSDREIH